MSNPYYQGRQFNMHFYASALIVWGHIVFSPSVCPFLRLSVCLSAKIFTFATSHMNIKVTVFKNNQCGGIRVSLTHLVTVFKNNWCRGICVSQTHLVTVFKNNRWGWGEGGAFVFHKHILLQFSKMTGAGAFVLHKHILLEM